MNVSYIFLNGRIISAADASISPFDRGFLYGDGLFETMRLYRGRAHLLGRHLDRLARSGAVLRIPPPSREELIVAVEETIRANNVEEGVLRLTLTRGIGEQFIDEPEKPTLLITLRPLLQIGSGRSTKYEVRSTNGEELADDDRSEGADAGVRSVDARANAGTEGRGTMDQGADLTDDGPVTNDGERIITLNARHALPEIGVRIKTLDYTTAIYSSRELADAGVREGLLLMHDGIVAEGTVSNIFCVRNGALTTPPLSIGVLAGVTRGRVLELAAMRGIEIREEPFDLPFLLGADECFYTNSVREVVPVTHLDGRRIGDGRPGPVALDLLAAYRAEAPSEWV